ncbi:hypothetical protein GCM10022398_14660 [Acetobacter lovaniensis]
MSTEICTTTSLAASFSFLREDVLPNDDSLETVGTPIGADDRVPEVKKSLKESIVAALSIPSNHYAS